MIRKAQESDLKQVNELMTGLGFLEMEPALLQDLCLVAEVQEKIVGVIWASVSQSKIFAYVDYLTVHPEHKGWGPKLALALLGHLMDQNVKYVTSIVKEHAYFQEAMRLNLISGMQMNEGVFRFFMGNVQKMGEKWAHKIKLHKSQL